MSLGFVNFRDGGTFGGLSGMLRQILSPSPEQADIGLAGCCNYLQPSVFMNHPTMMPSSLQMAPSLSHLSVLYPEQPVLHEHVQILGESYSCPNCGLEFRTILKLNYHIKTSHPQREEIDNRNQMNIVQAPIGLVDNNIINQPRYTCQICSRTFLAQSHLRMHEVTHSTPMNSVTSTSYVQTPNVATRQEKTFSCDQCQATFRYRTLLERHKKLHETNQDKPYSCPKCFMRFETRNLYNHHAKTHKPDCRAVGTIAPTAIVPATPINIISPQSGLLTTSNPSYPCDSCTKEFPTPELLNSHKSVHRLRPLVCDVCGKGFTHRKYYVVHQRIHTGERPYLCAMCGKSFTQASTLTVHRRYHTGERPYTCTLCGKGFVTRTIMLNHMKKH
ncbi:zinc finger protein 267-like [Leptopilina heterotoma]|uniref:zinc finger protein 267-like n=1 Tax=Leptopilina heterotoma TaxID=63436 RepID=UPI001CA95033|nr:zinc finger protein 267-like [Leptopilina heterotoma]